MGKTTLASHSDEKKKWDALCEVNFVNANRLYKYKLFLGKIKY